MFCIIIFINKNMSFYFCPFLMNFILICIQLYNCAHLCNIFNCWLFFVFWYYILNFNNLINVYFASVHDKYIMLIKLKILSSHWHITPLKLTIFWTAENYTERKVYNNGNAQGTCIGGWWILNLHPIVLVLQS